MIEFTRERRTRNHRQFREGEELEKRFKGDTKVETPPKSATEQAIEQKNYELLLKQDKENEMFKPLLYQQYGVVDDGGKLRRMTDDELQNTMTPEQRNMYEISKLSGQRLKDAYEGKLPVSPAMEKQFEEEEKAIRESLSRMAGPQWENSTAGIQKYGEFKTRRDLLREEARRGQIDTGTGLLLSQMGYLGDSKTNNINTGNLLGNRLGTVRSGYLQSLQPYQYDRGLQFQANVANAKRGGGPAWGALGTALGTGAGLLLAPATGGTTALLASGALGGVLGGGLGGFAGSLR